jgi:hypothetical protein
LLEVLSDSIRNEPRAQGIHVPVTVGALLLGIETMWDNQVKMVFRPGHCDIEQTALLFYFGSAFRRQIRWYAAVDAVQHDRLKTGLRCEPFLPNSRIAVFRKWPFTSNETVMLHVLIFIGLAIIFSQHDSDD